MNTSSSSYLVADKPVLCPHCGHGKFSSRKILMNTRGASFINLDWLNQRATALTCQNCSRIEWFQDEPRASA